MSSGAELLSRIALGLSLALTLACGGEGDESPPAERPSVVASIFPIADLARALGGDAVEVVVLLAPGASPATFELTPAQLRSLRAATVYLSVGAGLDGWVGDPPPAGGRTSQVILTQGLVLEAAEGHDEAGNPHVWLDPVLVRDHLLPQIARALTEAAPTSRERIRAGHAAMADSLTALEREIRQTLAPLENRAFLASHPAWTYFARRFGLLELGTVHSGPGDEPSPRALARLIDRARAAEVEVVFAEPQLGEAAAHALAEELGARVLVLDPLGGPDVPGRDGYLSLLRYNTAQLFDGLGGAR